MKKILLIVIGAVVALGAQASPDIKDILQGLGSKKSSAETTGQTTQSTEMVPTKSGGLSDILDGVQQVGNKLGIIPSKKVTVDYLMGQWDYKKPAVAFKSDNFLAKAGGVAASAKVEGELEPYYKTMGFDKMVMTVNADSTFTMKLSRGSLSGTIRPAADDGTLTFSFKVLGIPMGSMTAYVNAETSKTMSITFDVSKLLPILSKVASMSGMTSMKALSALLNQYDGLTAGFYLNKTAEPAKDASADKKKTSLSGILGR